MSLLSIEGISKSYGPIPALRDLSLEVRANDIFALLGPDGAGKTTLVRILCHRVRPDAGTASLDGIDLLRDFSRAKHLIGYMPQIFSLYPDLSVEENLTFYAGVYGIGRGDYRRRRDELYGFSNLAPFAGRRAGALSGGMKQKLALSCALLHEPRLLLLDEPTTGVDPLSRGQLWEILLKFRARGTTILVSTPYMDEAGRADRASLLHAGRKMAEGTPAELAAQFRGEIYRLAGLPEADIVERVNAIPGISARRFGAALHLYLPPGEGLAAYEGALHGAGLDAERLRKIEPDLEDRFIQLMEHQP